MEGSMSERFEIQQLVNLISLGLRSGDAEFAPSLLKLADPTFAKVKLARRLGSRIPLHQAATLNIQPCSSGLPQIARRPKGSPLAALKAAGTMRPGLGIVLREWQKSEAWRLKYGR